MKPMTELAIPAAAAVPESGAIARPRIDLTGPLPGVLALAAGGVYAATLPPVSDHAWQFYMAERALDGARLYVDVGAADMHPPLITWLAMAVAAVGRMIGIPGLELYPLLVFSAIAATAAIWWKTAPASGWMLPVLALSLIAFAGPYFGQGEHLALILSIPWLLGTAEAAQGRPLSRGRALAAAIAAGIGLALKPHFALVWIGVEGVLAVRRGWRSLLRIECVTIGAVFVLYVVATLILTPTLFSIVPWLAKLYPNFGPRAFQDVLLDRRALLLLAALVASLTVRSRDAWQEIARVFAITAIAMYVALLLQGKGWGYHWYPVVAIALILGGLALRPLVGRLRIAAPLVMLVAALWMQRQSERTLNLLVNDPTWLPGLMELVEEHAAGESIVGLSHLLQTGFPLVNLTGTRWASPYAHLWMVPAMYSDSRGYARPIDYRETGEWQPLEQEMFDRIWSSIERENPALTIIHVPLASGFDMRAYFETDARFRERFARSPVIGTVGRYIVLGRPSPVP